MIHILFLSTNDPYVITICNTFAFRLHENAHKNPCNIVLDNLLS